MVEFLGFVLLIVAVFAAVCIGFAVGLTMLARFIFPSMLEETAAFLASGVLPVGFSAFWIIDFFTSNCCENGPQGQGAVIGWIASFVLAVLVWPIGYRFGLRKIIDSAE